MTPSQLKSRLDTLGLSGPQFAEIINRDRRTVLRWLRGESPVPDWVEYRLESVEKESYFDEAAEITPEMWDGIKRLPDWLFPHKKTEKESPFEYFTHYSIKHGDTVMVDGKTYKIIDPFIEKESGK